MELRAEHAAPTVHSEQEQDEHEAQLIGDSHRRYGCIAQSSDHHVVDHGEAVEDHVLDHHRQTDPEQLRIIGAILEIQHPQTLHSLHRLKPSGHRF